MAKNDILLLALCHLADVHGHGGIGIVYRVHNAISEREVGQEPSQDRIGIRRDRSTIKGIPCTTFPLSTTSHTPQNRKILACQVYDPAPDLHITDAIV